MKLPDDSAYEYQVGGSLITNAPTYVTRQADSDLYNSLKAGEFCYSILSLNFKIDDFFAVLRNCYNKRAEHPDYRRLTFTLIGTATPSDLLQNQGRNPFNIGRSIELSGFELHEAQHLALGLAKKARNPQRVLQAVLDWTGGQPFLTQKVCKLIWAAESEISPGHEAEWVEKLVRSHIIEHWEAQDEPQHLRTIRARLLSSEQKAGRLLGLCQQIWQQGEIAADGSPEQMELRLTGLAVRHKGKLKFFNRIYQEVFNQSWIEQQLHNLRPYSEAFRAWVASDCQDNSRLLRGVALQEALAWVNGKSLSDRDFQFLMDSQAWEKQEVETTLKSVKIALKAEQQLTQVMHIQIVLQRESFPLLGQSYTM